MNSAIILRNIANKVYKCNQTPFSIDVEKQKHILSSFPEPNDLFDRSYFQYKCQMKQLSAVLVFIQSIVACVLFPIYYIKLSSSRKISTHAVREKSAVFITDGIPIQTIPECLKLEYNEIIPFNLAEEMYIDEQGKKMLSTLFSRYWYSPYFVFKCMLKIGMYAAVIKAYNPSAIMSYSEYSFTSSILTEYCHLRSVEHINIMHGEKLFNIRDTFVQYDRYYVWDEHYIHLLTDLRAEKKQFRIAVPNSVRIHCTKFDEPNYDFTYYLGGEKTEELRNIRDELKRTGVPLSRLCIRYHPRYCDANEIIRIFIGFQIENPTEVPLDVSLSKTKYVVSLYSTVLYQAYEGGKEIIIDDVTDKVKYEKLKDLRYIMLGKPHGKLSEYISHKIENKYKVS